MSRKIVASVDGTRDINPTCNVLHVARSSQFNTSAVLDQIMLAQGMLASGVTLPADVNEPYGATSGVKWLGGASSDVLACSWAKDLDGVVGTISLQLKPRTEYLETILPGDLLFVFMDDAGDYDPTTRFSGTLITVVIVDRCSQATRVQNHATTNVVSVSARDLAVILSESATVFDSSFAQLENAMFTGEFIGRLFGDKKQNALSPLENVLILLLLLYDAEYTGSKLNELQWKLTASADAASASQLVSLLDVTTYVQNPLPFYSLAEPPGIIQAGNVWSLLDSYANTLVNEFFIDVRDSNPQERQFRQYQSKNATDTYYADNPVDVDNQNTTVQTVLASNVFRSDATRTEGGSTVPDVPDGATVVALVMRQRPLDDEAFNNLPYTEVDSTEIDSLEIARSSHDVFNWFRVRFPNIDVKLQEIVAGIRIVPQSIAKFGFRRMDAQTRYMFTSSAGSLTFKKGNTKTDFSDVFEKYIDLLTSWFNQNEFWYAGQLSMRFKPGVRVGTRLRLTKDNQLYDFYVQGVQQNFVASPGGSRSMYVLTRGRVVSQATIPDVPTADFQHDGFTVNDGAQ